MRERALDEGRKTVERNLREEGLVRHPEVLRSRRDELRWPA
jgi:hypothetical protein